MGAIELNVGGSNNAIYVNRPKKNDAGRNRLIGYNNGTYTEYGGISGMLTKGKAYFGKNSDGTDIEFDGAFGEVTYTNDYGSQNDIVIILSDGTLSDGKYFVFKMPKYNYNTLFLLNTLAKGLHNDIKSEILMYCTSRTTKSDKYFSINGGMFAGGELIKNSGGVYAMDDLEKKGVIKVDKSTRASKLKAEQVLIEVIDDLYNKITELCIINDSQIYSIETQKTASNNSNNNNIEIDITANDNDNDNDNDSPF